jgi:hypothetical protein
VEFAGEDDFRARELPDDRHAGDQVRRRWEPDRFEVTGFGADDYPAVGPRVETLGLE